MADDELATLLLESEQQLQQLPELERQLASAEADRAALRAELSRIEATLREVVGSPSWRLTAPLRQLRGLFASHDRG